MYAGFIVNRVVVDFCVIILVHIFGNICLYRIGNYSMAVVIVIVTHLINDYITSAIIPPIKTLVITGINRKNNSRTGIPPCWIISPTPRRYPRNISRAENKTNTRPTPHIYIRSRARDIGIVIVVINNSGRLCRSCAGRSSRSGSI